MDKETKKTYMKALMKAGVRPEEYKEKYDLYLEEDLFESLEDFLEELIENKFKVGENFNEFLSKGAVNILKKLIHLGDLEETINKTDRRRD